MKMRILGLVLVFSLVGSAYAELQNVEVGGEIRIRFRANLNYQNGPAGLVARRPQSYAYGIPVGAGGFLSRYRFDDQGNDNHYAEMRTRLNVKADFSDNVGAFIQLDSYDVWGEDFRSGNYLTGADSRAMTTDDVEVLQAYIEVRELWGTPLSLKIGRQMAKLDKGWLIGDEFTGLIGMSLDAILLTYAWEDLTVRAIWSKLVETSPAEEDGDVDFYAVHGTYAGLEALNLSGYWFFLRDARAIPNTSGPFLAGLEGLLGLGGYDTTTLHTVGIRAWGEASQWDYDLELAYQFGNAGQHGALFPMAPWMPYGDNDAEYDSWGTDLEVGYTFDVKWQPRVYLGGAYFDGEDNREASFWEWLNPFTKPQASVSFNRLLANANRKYSFILDSGQTLSNFSDLRTGVIVEPTDSITVGFEVEKFWVNEPFHMPVFAPLNFWTKESSRDLGIQASLWGKYYYTDDLWVRFRWEHLFAGEGIKDGNFVDGYGTRFLAGSDDDDADYIECMFGITF